MSCKLEKNIDQDNKKTNAIFIFFTCCLCDSVELFLFVYLTSSSTFGFFFICFPRLYCSLPT